MKHPIRRRLMYLSFQGLRLAVQVLPLGAARALGRGVAAAAYPLLRAQRRLTILHLKRALGRSLTSSQRSRLARRVFLNLGQNMMEWLVLPRLSQHRLQKIVKSDGVDHLRAALKQGRGAIVVTPHFGNWEYISPYLRTLGFAGGVLARRLRYPEYESFLIRLREARGIQTLQRGSVKEAAKLLRSNQVLGLLPDQDVDSLEGIFVDFFGQPAHTPVGPANLSLMTGAPIVPCFMIRDSQGFRLVIEPAVSAPQTADRAEAAKALTTSWSQVFETYIRRYPDHWVWMHRRWKTQPGAGAQGPVTSEKRDVARRSSPLLKMKLVVPSALAAGCLLLVAAFTGCGKPDSSVGTVDATPTAGTAMVGDASSDAQMSVFELTGYEQTGAKRWTLDGHGASVDGNIVTILRPDAVGYDPERTAYITAGAAQMDQTTRHVRMEYDVTVHTSDGLWLTAPVLHWIPDSNEMATDTPVRIETDHMLLRGRGMKGLTQLKEAVIFDDIELVLNPTDDEPPGPRTQVIITCDGPLSLDYENNIATFEKNVHVQDPRGDLYSDRLIAYLNQTSHTIRYAEAIGSVRMSQHDNEALSERAVYEPGIGKITLVGKPSLLIYPEDDQPQTAAFGAMDTVTTATD